MPTAAQTEIYHFITDCGEAFFDKNGQYLAGWHENDANWRSEYMNPLLNNLGIKIIPTPTSLYAQFKRKVLAKSPGLY